MASIPHTASAQATLPFWRQIRWHLIVSFVLLALVPAVIVAIATSMLIRGQAQERIFNQLQSAADLKHEQITLWINDSGAALNLLLSGPVAEQFLTAVESASPEARAQANATLRGAASPAESAGEHVAQFRRLFLYTPDGRIIAASDESMIGRIVSRQPYFTPSLAGEHVQPPYYAIGSGEMVMVMTRQLRGPDGQLAAVLGGEIDLTMLGQIMLGRSGLGESGETYLVSLESRYLLTPSRFEGYPLTRAYRSEGIDRALAGERGTGIYSDYRSPPVEVFGAYRWVPELQAGLLAEIDASEALAATVVAQRLSVGLTLGAALVALALGLLVATQLSRPIVALTNVAAHIASGNLGQRVTINMRNELGVLAAGFNTMADRLQETLQGLEQRVAERTTALESALAEQEQTLAELRETISAREELQATVRGMSSPVMPVLDGVLVMPLIGLIDSQRAELLTTSLLEGIERHHARVVILDVTGVPIVDTQVARALMRAAEAARLLGAEPVLVGIRPELAHTIVGLGLDLSALATQADLQSGIRYAAARQGTVLLARPSISAPK